MKLELTALLIQVTQQTIEEVEKIFASGETTEELFWSVRIVDKFESFILFLIKDQPEQEQVDLSIFYKITTKCKHFLRFYSLLTSLSQNERFHID